MEINLLSRDRVKIELGIDDSTYDATIDSLLPIVSNDVRRILNNNFDEYYPATFTAGSTELILDQRPFYCGSSCCLPFNLGQVITNPDIPEDTYITSFNPNTGKYTISSTPVDSGDHIYPTIQISQWGTISKMIWYRITIRNTDDAESKELKSVKIGTYSETYAESEINSKYNYPQKLINDLGPRFAKV